MGEKVFVNGFESWSETFFFLTDMLSDLLRQHNHPLYPKAHNLLGAVGFVGMCREVERWTDEFEKESRGRDGGEFYYDAEDFFYEKVGALEG